MTTMALWGLIQAVVMTVVIAMNGMAWRSGWLAGAFAQGVMVVFGFGIYREWTFLFLLLPMSGFIANWYMHEKRKHKARVTIIARLSEEEEYQIVRRYCFRNKVTIITDEFAERLHNLPKKLTDHPLDLNRYKGD